MASPSGTTSIYRQLDLLDRAARKYRHSVHSKMCNCAACVELLKALASLDYGQYDFADYDKKPHE